MANEKQLAILKQGAKIWNEWRKDNPSESIDLKKANLRRLDLGDIDFSNADLRFSDMEAVNLTGANLVGANAKDVNLRDADLTASKLTAIKLTSANLRMAKLNDANLMRATLSRAKVKKASFYKARLSGARFVSADIKEVDFTSSDLRDVNFSGAHLNNAKFQEADLKGAIFRVANLENADFTHAICAGTVFSDIDLSNVKGLETIKHISRSSISIGTLFRTKPRLPDIFLRGCGVPEILITYLPSLMETAVDFYSCFISYSSADQSFARRLYDALQGRGIRCWLDEKQVNPGDDIYEEIHRGIVYWDKVLLCCSKSSLSEKWWVDQEINKAFQKERDLMREHETKVKVLIPLDLDGYLFSSEFNGAKGDELRSRIAANFKGWKRNNDKFDREIERVIKALRTDGGKEPPPKSKL